MAKYTKRADGRYVATLSINGKRKYFYSTSEKELDLMIAEYKVNRSRGTISTNPNVTFEDYADGWFERNMTMKAYATQSSIRNILKNHIYPEIGLKKIKDIKAYHIQEIVKHMVDKDLKDIVKRTVATIKRILEDAINNDIIYKNVAVNIHVPKYVKNERKPLSVTEDKLVVDECQKNKYGLFILLIRYTGIRLEEAVPILLTDFDLNRNTVTINKAVTFINNQAVVKATKNLKSRTIPLPKIIIKPLKEEIQKRQKNRYPLPFLKRN